MEGSESGALVPSDTFMEAEIWVKLSNFPAEFLTSLAISTIVSSFGSPVMTDEDTYEKLENHKWPPKLRRKLHSRITFVRALVRVRVTAPLPSCMAVFCPKGRKYIIGLDFDPIPKLCLLCSCAGHFDFECCGTDKVSVEIIDEAGEGCLDVNARCADCSDGFRADFNGEQGAALMVDSPVASCDIGAAAAPELMPLLPATDHGVQGTLISEGSGSFEDPPVLVVDPLFLPPAPGIVGDAATDPEGTVFTQGSVSCEVFPVLEVDPTTDGLHSYEDSTVVEAALKVDSHILPAASRVIGAAATPDLMPLLPATDYGVQGTLISDGVIFEDATVVEAMNFPAAICDVGDAIVDPCIVDEQLSGVFHKWRDFTDDQGLSEVGSGTGVGLLDVEVQDFSPVVEADLVENFLNIEQLFSVVNNPRKHHKWRDESVVLGLWCVTLDEQGMFSFGKLDLLQMLSRLVWNLAATYYEQVCFKIHHKWRDKGY